MRDKLKEEIAIIIAKYRDEVQTSAMNDYKTPCPTVLDAADQILALEVPGWVVKESCPLSHLGEYCHLASYQVDCQQYADANNPKWCISSRPATQQEVNDGKAVKV